MPDDVNISNSINYLQPLTFVSGAYIDLISVKKMKPQINKLSAQQLQSDAVFEYIAEQLKLDPSKGKAVNGIFLYVITKDGKQAKQWSKYFKCTCSSVLIK